MEPQNSTPEEFDLVVYVGPARAQKGGLCHVYKHVSQVRDQVHAGVTWRTLAKPLDAASRPGQQCRVYYAPDDRTKVVRAEAAGDFAIRQKRLDWAAAGDALTRQVKAEVARKGQDELAEAVAPLRRAYDNCPASQRPQLLARIIYLLTK